MNKGNDYTQNDAIGVMHIANSETIEGDKWIGEQGAYKFNQPTYDHDFQRDKASFLPPFVHGVG